MDTKSVKFDLPSSIVPRFTSQIVVVSHYVSLSVIIIDIGNVLLHGAQIPSQDTTQTDAAAGFSSVKDPRSVQPSFSPPRPSASHGI